MKKSSVIHFLVLISLFYIQCKESKKSKLLYSDNGAFLNDYQAHEISEILADINKRNHHTIMLYTVKSEKQYSNKNSEVSYDEELFGNITKGDTLSNDIMLYLSYLDRKIKIQLGRGAKILLTDSLKYESISRLVPYMVKRRYYEGIKNTIIYIDSICNSR